VGNRLSGKPPILGNCISGKPYTCRKGIIKIIENIKIIKVGNRLFWETPYF